MRIEPPVQSTTVEAICPPLGPSSTTMATAPANSLKASQALFAGESPDISYKIASYYQMYLKEISHSPPLYISFSANQPGFANDWAVWTC